MKWHGQYSIVRRAVELACFRHVGAETHVVESFTVHERTVKEGELVEPALVLDLDEAQTLLQALWDSGLRPNNGEGSSGQVAALKDHLADMRKIAFMRVNPLIVSEPVNL
jgi:hypothetical protein